MKYRKSILFMMLLTFAFFCGCSKNESDPDNVLCGKWVRENKIDGLPEWTMTITDKEIKICEGEFIWSWFEYELNDYGIITNKDGRRTRPYSRLELHNDDDEYLRIYGIAITTDGEIVRRDTYVKDGSES